MNSYLIFVFFEWAFIIFLIYLIIKGLANPKTRKRVLLLLGVIFLIIVLLIGRFVYSLNKAMRWQEQDRDSLSNSYLMTSLVCEPLSRNFESFYKFPSFNDSDYWCQTGWYSSAEELADAMSLDDSQKTAFIEMVNRVPEVEEFCNRDLDRVPGNDNREVRFYEINLTSILSETQGGWNIGYFYIVDENTSEVSIATFYLET